MAGIASPTSLLVSAGVGAAAAAALEPAFELPRQDAWQRNPNRVLDPSLLANLVAQGAILLGDAEDEASRQGYTADKLHRLVYGQQTLAPEAQLMLLWRYGIISDAAFEQGLTKLGRHPDWIQYVKALRSTPLTGEILAVMIQRAVIPDQGQLPNVQLDTTGKVPRYPQVELDAYKEAAAYGMSNAQLDAYARIQGLPPGLDAVARGVYRGILDPGDFNLAAEQSNRRVEWAPYEFDIYREIPTARDYVDAYIRAWITRAECYAGTARHGMSQADTDLLILDYGRPMTARQVFQAERRGGVYDGPTDQIDPAFLKSMEESNRRPEWYNLEWAYRETYPSYFVLRPLLQSGAITEARATELFLGEGWPEDIAKAAPSALAGASTTTATSYPKKAEGQLWTTTHNAYKNGEITSATVTTNLDVIGVSATDQAQVLKFWDAERATIRKQLSPTQIKKAYAGQVPNPATGAAWTLQDAITALLDRGYDQADAETLLAE